MPPFVLIDSDGEEGEIDEEQVLEERESVRRCRQIILFEYKQNDPKRDTGMKLVRKGLARSIVPGAAFKGIVLSAQGRSVLSTADAALIASTGIGAVNCSWNRLDEINNIPGGNIARHRKLPFLVAANPINYGKAFKLSTAEAIAGGLAIAGFPDDARRVTEKFSWHDEFWKLNSDMIDAYAACASSREVIQVQEVFMAPEVREKVEYGDVGVDVGEEGAQNEVSNGHTREEKLTEEKNFDNLPSLPPPKRGVSFNPTLCEIKEFEKNSPIASPPPIVVPLIIEQEVPVPQFPSEAPKDQRSCLLFLKSLSIAESIGIPKHATGNALSKMKRKEYLEIWAKFIAVDEHVKYVTDLELACRK